MMNSPHSMVAPVLVLAAILAAFMTADKLWLHWYAADTAGIERKAQLQVAGATQKPTPGGNAAEPSVPTASPQPGDAQDGAPAASAQSRDAFAALWLTSQQAIYRVRYETSSENGEKGDSYVVFNRPPSARVDTISAGATEPSSQIILGRDGSTVACAFDGGKRNCGQIKPFDASLPLAAGPIVFPAAGSFGSIDVADLESKMFAGVPARCFRVLSSDPPDAADYCFSGENVPVYGSGTFGIIEASELTTPSDADFDLPTP
jgi:hypothetical protein